jgi:hypothetical protein
MPRNLLEEFEAALAQDAQNAPWGAMVLFLDTITSLTEWEVLKGVVPEGSLKPPYLRHYEKTLTRWPDPKLPEGFAERFPIVTARLDTPEKVRVFLRGADFQRVGPMVMGAVFEDIIRRHDIQEEPMVIYRERRDGDPWQTALQVVWYSQIQPWALTRLLLPGHTLSGYSTEIGTFIDWRSEKERRLQVTPTFSSHIGVASCGRDINGRTMVRCDRCETIAHAVDEATARADLVKTSCAPYCLNCRNLRESHNGRPTRPEGGSVNQRLHVCSRDNNRWWQSNDHFHLWQQVTSDEEWRVLQQTTMASRTLPH